uniref:ATP synthase F0 subunit 8 n=1 Tax=Lepidonotus sp. YZ-2018 TaxID=2153334 RepID=A0A343W6B9_9ANNE|nr:ATP synthase F0 subunit 8 [Lepidonotus sp. YZ-2018]
MPHLSPLNWIISPIIFWLLLAMFSSILWWSQTLYFPTLSSSISSPSPNKWSW